MQKFFVILLLLAFFPFILTQTLPKDVDALEDIKKLVLSSNISLRNWEKSVDPCGDVLPCGINDLEECNWEGLACVIDNKDRHRVAGIAIEGTPDRKLRGNLPKTLPAVLKSISLPNNGLTGTFLDSNCSTNGTSCKEEIWLKNTHLKVVDLGGNELEGDLPHWRGLTRLEVINISNNDLGGPLPPVWKKKIHLRQIDLSSNSLSGTLPSQWSELAALRKLVLANNDLRDQIPVEWYSMKNLELLDVSDNCAICGNVSKQTRILIDGDRTNLNTACSKCDGCQCHQGTLKAVVTNGLLSLSVLVLALFSWFLYQWCKKNETQELPMQNPVPMVIKPFEPPTIVVSPGDELFFARVADEGEYGSHSETSSSTSKSSLRDSSEEEESSEEWYSDSDTDSVVSKVLAFMHNSSPVIRVSDRTRSSETTGIPEIIPEKYNSDQETRTDSVNSRLRRSRSAFGSTSGPSLAIRKEEPVLETDMGASSSTQSPLNVPLPSTSSSLPSKESKQKSRSFRRRKRRGIVGDFRISEPQQSFTIPEDINPALSTIQPSQSKATQTTDSFSK